MSTLLPYLLERGCRVFLSPLPFDQTKLLVVEGAWHLVGSTNWDPRRMRRNFEFHMECYSAELGTQLTEIVRLRTIESEGLSLADCQYQKWTSRLRNDFARLFSPWVKTGAPYVKIDRIYGR